MHNIIASSLRDLLRDNLRNGVKEEFLLKQNFSIELILEVAQELNKENEKNKISDEKKRVKAKNQIELKLGNQVKQEEERIVKDRAKYEISLKKQLAKETRIILRIKRCYDKVGTIKGVSEALNLQEWRVVRKYLRKGHRLGLFYYDKYSKKKTHRKVYKEKFLYKKKPYERDLNKRPLFQRTRSFIDEHFSPEDIIFMLKVNDCYNQVGTIKSVSEALNLQEWRVSKYLRKGHWGGIFVYKNYKRRKSGVRKQNESNSLVEEAKSDEYKFTPSLINYSDEQAISELVNHNPNSISEEEITKYIQLNRNALRIKDSGME